MAINKNVKNLRKLLANNLWNWRLSRKTKINDLMTSVEVDVELDLFANNCEKSFGKLLPFLLISLLNENCFELLIEECFEHFL